MLKFKLHRTHLLRVAVIIHDLLAAGIALVAALTLRLGQLPDAEFATTVLWFMAIAGVLGHIFGLNSGVWRYASLADLEAIIKTATLTVLGFALSLFLVNRLGSMPRTAIVMSWAAMIMALSGSRLAYRLMRNRRTLRRVDGPRNVLLLGASGNAENFLKAVNERADLPYRVLGLVDDRDRRTGLSIRGCRVLGSAKDIDAVIASLARRGLSVEALILTKSASSRGDQTFDIVAEAAKRHGLQLLRLPDLSELQGELGPAALLPRPIVLEDVLPRRAINLCQGRDQRIGRRFDGAGDRCRRLDRLRALPPDCSVSSRSG